MRRFDSKLKDAAYSVYGIMMPVFDPITFVRGLYGYIWFVRDMIKYQRLSSKNEVSLVNIFPQLHDRTKYAPFDGHYYYQQLWVFDNVVKNKPRKHVDIASTYELSGYISKVTKSVFLDYRPVKATMPNLEVVSGDILKLPFENNSITSLSCLHVVEHIGLGRYGDPLDPEGFVKSCLELQRVLAKGGKLYLSVPVGKERLYFNAHRVSSPLKVPKIMKELKLLSFGVIDDYGNYTENADPKKYKDLDYGCGLYCFTKAK